MPANHSGVAFGEAMTSNAKLFCKIMKSERARGYSNVFTPRERVEMPEPVHARWVLTAMMNVILSGISNEQFESYSMRADFPSTNPKLSVSLLREVPIPRPALIHVAKSDVLQKSLLIGQTVVAPQF
jgi:hypothetical protein